MRDRRAKPLTDPAAIARRACHHRAQDRHRGVPVFMPIRYADDFIILVASNAEPTRIEAENGRAGEVGTGGNAQRPSGSHIVAGENAHHPGDEYHAFPRASLSRSTPAEYSPARTAVGQGWLRLFGQKSLRDKWICLSG